MHELKTTAHFEKWLKKLKDKPAKAWVLICLKLLEQGHMDDWKAAGDKSTQVRDIEKAKNILKNLEE